MKFLIIVIFFLNSIAFSDTYMCGFNNFEVDGLKTGKCKFGVFTNPLSTK